VERLGMQRTAGQIEAADLVLIVVDASQPLDEEDRAVLQHTKVVPSLIVLNKIDLPAVVSAADLGLNGEAREVAVSAKSGEGLSDLRRLVISVATGGKRLDQPRVTVTNIRHVDALSKAAESLRLARESIRDHLAPDVVAVDVQDAIDHLATVTGAITSEDVLDRVFNEFCIGK
jgi:tRNA modification GTPase